MERAYTPLANYIGAQVGMPVKLEVPKSYADLLAGCKAKKYQLAYLGGFLYIKASDLGYELVAQSKDSRNIRGVFITQDISDIRTLGDLKGKSFAFGDRHSTSGFLMPTHFLDLNNLPASATFKSVVHSLNNEDTVKAVVDFKVDAGVIEERTLARMTEKGNLQPGQVRAIWTTPPYPDSSWSMRKDLGADLKSKIINAFLKPNKATAEHFKVYDYIVGNAFTRPRHGWWRRR